MRVGLTAHCPVGGRRRAGVVPAPQRHCFDHLTPDGWRSLPGRRCDSRGRRAFSLVELLVVMLIIAILVGALGTVVANYITRSKVAATAATIERLQGLVIQRRQALDRAVESPQFAGEVQKIVSELKKQNVGFKAVSADVLTILLKKEVFRLAFPQTFYEASLSSPPLLLPSQKDLGPDGKPGVAGQDDDGNGIVDDLLELGWPGSDDGPRDSESSELLYAALTKGAVFGTAPVDEGQFSTSEVGDWDQDGLPEFVDGWGRPLRFYRWPTRLFKPWGLLGLDGAPGVRGRDDDGNGQVDQDSNGLPDLAEVGSLNSDDEAVRKLAAVLFSGLPSRPQAQGERDLLNEDPDDPTGKIAFEIIRLRAATGGALDFYSVANESRWHTWMTFHRPLIVSAGPDGELGLFEPYYLEDTNLNGQLDPGEDRNGDGRLNYGTLAEPLPAVFGADGKPGRAGVDDDNDGVVDESDEFGAPGSDDDPSALTDNITNQNQRAGG